MCEAAAGVLGSSGKWVAVLSSAVTDAKDRFDITGPVCRLDGVIVADDESEWWSDTHLAPISLMVDGNPVPGGAHVWSGTTVAGESGGIHCDNWNSESANELGVIVGDPEAINADWVHIPGVATGCSASRRLYCIDQL
jgi:hypothetical protein